MLIQIDIINPSFLDQKQSQFAKKLKQLFKLIAESRNVDNELKAFQSLSKQYSIHEQGGGDSYQILYKFLSIINDNVSKEQTDMHQEQLNDFEKHILIISKDGYQCQQCFQFLQKELNQIQLIEEKDYSIDIHNFNELCNQPSIQQDSEMDDFCQNCSQQSKFKTKRTIINFPQFIIVKFYERQTKNLSKLECEKEILFQGCQSPYKIIGYSSYTGNHYTYTASYDGIWITFNDSRVYEEEQLFKNIFYLLLKKV